MTLHAFRGRRDEIIKLTSVANLKMKHIKCDYEIGIIIVTIVTISVTPHIISARYPQSLSAISAKRLLLPLWPGKR